MNRTKSNQIIIKLNKRKNKKRKEKAYKKHSILFNNYN
jgi:hypothetical protein